MKSLIIFSALLLVIGSIGCDGDGDSDGGTTVVVPGGTTGTDGDDAADDPADDPGTLVKADSVTANSGVATNTGTATASAAGTFRSVVTWSGAPDELVSFFKKEGSATTLGWAQGGSGFQGTTSVEAGANYTFYITNMSGAAVTVSYAIYFTAD